MSEEKLLNEAMKSLLQFGKEGARDFNDTLDKLFETSTHLNPIAPALSQMSASLKSQTLEANMELMKECLELSENELVKASIRGISNILEYILSEGAEIIDKIDRKLLGVWDLYQGLKSFLTLDFNIEDHIVDVDFDWDEPDNVIQEGTQVYTEFVVEAALTVLQKISDGITWFGNLW